MSRKYVISTPDAVLPVMAGSAIVASIGLGRTGMVKTIVLGSCVFVQGLFVRALPGGRIVVRVDETEFSGLPVGARIA